MFVFFGGGIGTVMRYLIAKILPYSGKGFPWNTYWANLLGCLLIGILTGYLIKNSSESQSSMILFASVGFCGGFTTFSSFANENLYFIRNLQCFKFNYWNSYGLSGNFALQVH